MKRVYMYTLYERIWHWLQALVILALLLTGLEVHSPDSITIFGFEDAVAIHGVLGLVLVLNAFLGLFYHLTTGAIRQYVPRPRDFFTLAIRQTAYYLGGIFRGEPHPIEKTAGSKLNPLQKITYLAILNLLLPLQVVTGLLILGLDYWPALGETVGGLPVLAPIHTLGSWLFAAFLLVHVYLTTTGHTPLSNLKAMVTGWEDVEQKPDGMGENHDESDGKETA